MDYFAGSTKQSLEIIAADDNGLELLGKKAVDFPQIYFSLAGPNNDIVPTLINLTSLTSPWQAGGLFERGNGVYRFDAPDAVFATIGKVRCRGSKSGFHIFHPVISVIANPAGTGTIMVDHNYGGTDALAAQSTTGGRVAGCNIRAYLTSDYQAGNTGVGFVVATTSTDANGRWLQPMMLAPGTYTLVYSEQGFDTAAVQITAA